MFIVFLFWEKTGPSILFYWIPIWVTRTQPIILHRTIAGFNLGGCSKQLQSTRKVEFKFNKPKFLVILWKFLQKKCQWGGDCSKIRNGTVKNNTKHKNYCSILSRSKMGSTIWVCWISNSRSLKSHFGDYFIKKSVYSKLVWGLS